jgi:DNA-binding LacI/PurR family transcriptional regulator
MAPRHKSERVTIKTVAEDAGVSTAAVSKVLRDAYGVSAELRARVKASMQQLGYRPHAAARGMRGQTYTLGVLLPDIHNPFFSDILAGVNSALERTQYQVLLGISQSANAIEVALIDAMVDRQMDGIILIGPRIPTPDIVTTAERTPTVVIAHHRPEEPHFDTVNNNDQLGATMVVRHLVAGGYRSIAYLTQPLVDAEGTMVTTQREIGYRATMTELGLARFINVVAAEQTARETQTAARHLLQMRNPPEAIFCWTDFIALEVISVAHELGLRVPEDVAIVGYDNTSYCDLAQNALTSVDQSGQVLGLQSARLLVERIKGRETAEHLVITPRLVVRASSGGRATGRSPAPTG